VSKTSFLILRSYTSNSLINVDAYKFPFSDVSGSYTDISSYFSNNPISNMASGESNLIDASMSNKVVVGGLNWMRFKRMFEEI